MTSPIENQFAKMFNPKEKTHVLWLKRMNRQMEKMDPMTQQTNLLEMINENPMGARMSNGADWVFAHFGMAMAYTNAVLEGKAWIPPI
jgi:hypothetical protein